MVFPLTSVSPNYVLFSRNANGTKEGKGTGNTDILVPVSDKDFRLHSPLPPQIK